MRQAITQKNMELLPGKGCGGRKQRPQRPDASLCPGGDGGVMIQENRDDNVPVDVVNLLRKLIPQGVWLHDRQDGNGDAHLKSGLVGPSETIPLIDSQPSLSTWQNIFFCEFDGPRTEQHIVCALCWQQNDADSPESTDGCNKTTGGAADFCSVYFSRYCLFPSTPFHLSASGRGSFCSLMTGQVFASSALISTKPRCSCGTSISA